MLGRIGIGSRTRTRVWVTIAARRVDPSALLEECTRAAGIRFGESIAFDGASAALELRMRLDAVHHEARAPVAMRSRDRAKLVELLRALAADRTVQDIILETHVNGHEGVDGVSVLPLGALIAKVEHDQLRAAVRYVTDREDGDGDEDGEQSDRQAT